MPDGGDVGVDIAEVVGPMAETLTLLLRPVGEIEVAGGGSRASGSASPLTGTGPSDFTST